MNSDWSPDVDHWRPSDRYTVRRPLGAGGQGLVFLATDDRLNIPVVIKLPRVPILGGGERAARFRREAHAAARLDHPNLCRVYDVGIDQGQHYLVTAFVEGRPLDELFRDRVLAAADVVRIVRDLAGGLASAHRAGVVHRDVKPSNVIVRPDGTPVLVDFGIARVDGPDQPLLTAEGDALGTPAYMAPEQLAGDRAGPPADVFALGVVLYEGLAGVHPFPGPRYASGGGRVAPLDVAVPGLDVAVGAACLRALRDGAEPPLRSADEFAAALGGPRMGRPSPRRRGRRAAASVAAAVTALFLALPGPRAADRVPAEVVVPGGDLGVELVLNHADGVYAVGDELWFVVRNGGRHPITAGLAAVGRDGRAVPLVDGLDVPPGGEVRYPSAGALRVRPGAGEERVTMHAAPHLEADAPPEMAGRPRDARRSEERTVTLTTR